MSTRYFDPADPKLHDTLYETCRWLRDEHPVYHNPERNLYALSRFEDVEAALLDAENFRSDGVEEAITLFPMLVYMDNPRHDLLRALVSRAFTPRRIERLEPRIRDATRTLLDAFRGRNRVDLMQELALVLPNLVISELIGIPEERRATFLECTEALIRVGTGGAGDLRKPAEGIYREFSVLLKQRRAKPRDDLMSALLEAEVEGQRLDEQALLGFCFLLVVGGSDTTTNLIGNGAVLLAKHPEQREWLLAEPARIAGALEEMLRYESPAQIQPRCLSRDIEVRGVRLPEAARVLLMLGAAHHDERRFDDPERFDLQRDVGRHLAFGKGLHFCLGARLEARIAFEELLARHPHYELLAEPAWAPSRWARHHPSIEVQPGAA